jgi:hypothetical protein
MKLTWNHKKFMEDRWKRLTVSQADLTHRKWERSTKDQTNKIRFLMNSCEREKNHLCRSGRQIMASKYKFNPRAVSVDFDNGQSSTGPSFTWSISVFFNNQSFYNCSVLRNWLASSEAGIVSTFEAAIPMKWAILQLHSVITKYLPALPLIQTWLLIYAPNYVPVYFHLSTKVSCIILCHSVPQYTCQRSRASSCARASSCCGTTTSVAASV